MLNLLHTLFNSYKVHIVCITDTKSRGNDFPLKPLWSHEIGATEPVIAQQSPPVNTNANKQVLVSFHYNKSNC